MKQISKAILLAVAVHHAVFGQIVTDGSLGPQASLSGPTFSIGDSLGKRVGPNLFHSFKDFNIRANETATFSSSQPIQNVIARVTGGKLSQIDGTLRSDIESANLFLINPSGVFFGPKAEVDVKGSFAVSTANYLKLADGGVFDARLQHGDVLTAAAPSAFGFLPPSEGHAIAAVQFEGSRITGKNLEGITIAAGNIKLDAGARLDIPGGPLQLAAVASAGELPLTGLSSDSFETMGSISLNGPALISTGEEFGGHFVIRGANMTLAGEARATAKLRSRSVGTGQANEIELRGALELQNAEIGTAAVGNSHGSDLNIKAGAVALNGGSISAHAEESARGGSIHIQSGLISIDNGSIQTTAVDDAEGGGIKILADTLEIPTGAVETIGTASTPSGDIHLDVREMRFEDGSVSFVRTESEGDTGSINISANVIAIGNVGSISTSSERGKSGDIKINADEFKISAVDFDPGFYISADGYEGASGNLFIAGKSKPAVETAEWQSAWFSANSSGTGNSGSIHISAKTLILEDATISTDWDYLPFEGDLPPSGVAGNTVIHSEHLALLNSRISTGTSGVGDAGNITIETGTLLLEGEQSEISSAADGFHTNVGRAGNISITAKESASLKDHSRIRTSSSGDSDSGSLRIQTEILLVDSSASIQSGPDGFDEGGEGSRGGDIEIEARSISILDSGEISSATFSNGDGGDIRIRTEDLLIRDGSLTAGSSPFLLEAGDAGNIEITAKNIEVKGGGVIDTSTYGDGNAGQIKLRADRLLIETESSLAGITSEAIYGQGTGGNISIDAGRLELRSEGQVSSRTHAQGNAGNIDINAGLLTIEGRAQITSSTTGLGGDAGHIQIRADEITIDSAPPAGPFDFGHAGIVSESEDGQGAGGPILLQTGKLTLRSGGRISSSTESFGNAGNINIEANVLAIESNATITSSTSSFENGNAGQIKIRANQLTIDEGELASQSNSGVGTGGNIIIESGNIAVRAHGLISSTGEFGNAGNIHIQTRNLTIESDGQITSSTSGPGKAGDINIEADSLEILGGPTFLFTGILSESYNESAEAPDGDGGNISIRGDRIQMQGNGQISSSTYGSGGGGNIFLIGGDLTMTGISAFGPVVSSEAFGEKGQPGAAGSIDIDMSSVRLLNGATISSSSIGSSAAGAIRITGRQGISMDRSSLTVEAASNHGGTIVLASSKFVRVDESPISATAKLNGGNIIISAPIFGLNSSVVTANAELGDGGNIRIDSDLFYQLEPSILKVESSNQSAQQGAIIINSAFDFAGDVAILPGTFLTAQTGFVEGCIGRNPRLNSVTRGGKGGVVPNPSSFLPALNFLRP